MERVEEGAKVDNRMVHAVHVGRNDDPAKHSVKPYRHLQKSDVALRRTSNAGTARARRRLGSANA
jgi:hypothetical protein